VQTNRCCEGSQPRWFSTNQLLVTPAHPNQLNSPNAHLDNHSAENRAEVTFDRSGDFLVFVFCGLPRGASPGFGHFRHMTRDGLNH
jgi:hypothetical protein